MLKQIAPIVSVSLLICVLILSIFIIARLGKKSFSRNVYLGVLVFWCGALSCECYQLINLMGKGIDYEGYLYGSLITLSTPCQLSLIFYAATVIFYKQINLRTLAIFLSPAILFMALNIGWDLHQGLPLTNNYKTLSELKDNVGSITFMLRMAMLGVQLMYMVFIVYGIRKVVPIYNRYLANTQSNENYNLHWLYRFSTAICAIAVVYFIVAFHLSAMNIVLYSIVATGAFILLANCIKEYESLPKFSEVRIQWGLKRGWFTLEENEVTVKSKERSPESSESIRTWIIRNNLYADSNLSMRDVLKDFPNLSSLALIEILEQDGFTFQSFIRHIRIQMAIRVINSSKDNDLRYKDIYYKVGFSHYSSFARSFTSVMGISPSQYHKNKA